MLSSSTLFSIINGVQGASRCHKNRIVKPQFEDHEDEAGYEGADAADAAAGAGAADASARAADACAGAQACRRLGSLLLGGACSSCTSPLPCLEGGGTAPTT